jgi:hypothetical protein
MVFKNLKLIQQDLSYLGTRLARLLGLTLA